MDFIKSAMFTFIFVAFVLVGLSILPQIQGMPLASQVSHVANNTLLYIREFLSPIINLFYRYFG